MREMLKHAGDQGVPTDELADHLGVGGKSVGRYGAQLKATCREGRWYLEA